MTENTAVNTPAFKTPEQAEKQKRQPIFTKRPAVIMVQIPKKLAGVPEKTNGQGQFVKNLLRIDEAQKRGIDYHAYRGSAGEMGDTGLQIFDGDNVRIDRLMIQLDQEGYRPVNLFWEMRFDKSGKPKGPRTSIVFAITGDAIDLPQSVIDVLRATWRKVFIWANPKWNNGVDAKDGQHRVDTVNLTAGIVQEASAPVKDVVLKDSGHSYSLA